MKITLIFLAIMLLAYQAEAKIVKATVTGYCIGECCCGEYADGKTALGDDAAIYDGAAVSFEAIPKRTKILIPGIGVKEADDTGGAMRRAWREKGEYHIDIRFPGHKEAREWGIQELKIKILE